jgi:drug/metabolite transporter (DMT)-like permease
LCTRFLYNEQVSKVFVALFILVTSLALVVLKLGTKNGAPVFFADNKWQLNINLIVITGIFLYGLSFLLYIYLISKYPLGFIIPLTTAFVYLIIFTASYFIFDETFTALKVLGIALIIGGLIFLNIGSK